jgi:4-methylaminobutanoate oxidase (formaldehyde-forming)
MATWTVESTIVPIEGFGSSRQPVAGGRGRGMVARHLPRGACMTALPTSARAVVVGGGIAGCSIAYHLNKLGWRDVVLLEQGRLSGGTTWHAAGLVGQLRTHPSMTRLIRYSTELYAGLEAETGQATGWKRCGSLTVARTAERMTLLKRVAAMATAQGVACALLTPAEAGARWPIMETKDLVGAIWLPGDGKANPADITQALAKGARAGGTRIFEKTRVTSFIVETGVARGVRTAAGDIAAEVVVLAAGQWSRQLAASVGVPVPLHACEHMYIVTGRIDGVTPDLPCLRDPDGYIYFKEEVGGLLMGGFEPKAKPWLTDVPDEFEFGLLPDDWDQFEILMQNAVIRVPALEKAEVKRFLNGPESFTADNNYILGEAPQVRNLFVAAGFNSMGIASSGGAGRALAEWIVNGTPTLDLWPVDIRRFAPFNANRALLKDRVSEVLGLHYKMPWPTRELESARPLRRSPLYDRLEAKGAVWGSKMGWERPNVFAPAGASRTLGYGWGRPGWFDWHLAEQRACREAVAIFDMTSFAKLLVQGADAEAELQRLAANNVAVPVGTSVYTGLLNARGGYESDVTIARLAEREFLILTGTAQAERDADWIRRNLHEAARATLTDVTSAYTVLAVMGPRARETLARAGARGLEAAHFPSGAVRRIEIGYATCWACRRSYVGEAGFELYVPTEFAAAVYERLAEAGSGLGLRDAGYYALEGLRLEKGYRAWGRELTPDVTPYEAGLGFSVRLAKGTDFIGRAALEAARVKPPARRVVSLVAKAADAPLAHGGELVLADGRPVGEVTSAGFGAALTRPVMLGHVATGGAAVDQAWLAQRALAIDVGGEIVPVAATLKAPFDPAGARLAS